MELMVVPTPTNVSTSTTSDTIQNRVCSMAMMRVSDEVILVTVCAFTPVDGFALIDLTTSFEFAAYRIYGIFDHVRATLGTGPVLATSALTA